MASYILLAGALICWLWCREFIAILLLLTAFTSWLSNKFAAFQKMLANLNRKIIALESTSAKIKLGLDGIAPYIEEQANSIVGLEHDFCAMQTSVAEVKKAMKNVEGMLKVTLGIYDHVPSEKTKLTD